MVEYSIHLPSKIFDILIHDFALAARRYHIFFTYEDYSETLTARGKYYEVKIWIEYADSLM